MLTRKKTTASHKPVQATNLIYLLGIILTSLAGLGLVMRKRKEEQFNICLYRGAGLRKWDQLFYVNND